MKNHNIEDYNQQEARRLTNGIFNSLKKEYFIIGKRHVKDWHAWLSIGMLVGIISGVVLVANRTARFEASKATEEDIIGKYELLRIKGGDWSYDPSVEYGDNNIGWLAYSSAQEFKPGLVETYLAKTNDGGKTWIKVNRIDAAREVILQEKEAYFLKL